jgi:hypothetical protein
MLSEIGSWRRHENSVRFVGSSRVTFSSRPLGVVLDRFIRTSPRVRNLNFRFADHPGARSAGSHIGGLGVIRQVEARQSNFRWCVTLD